MSVKRLALYTSLGSLAPRRCRHRAGRSVSMDDICRRGGARSPAHTRSQQHVTGRRFRECRAVLFPAPLPVSLVERPACALDRAVPYGFRHFLRNAGVRGAPVLSGSRFAVAGLPGAALHRGPRQS